MGASRSWGSLDSGGPGETRRGAPQLALILIAALAAGGCNRRAPLAAGDRIKDTGAPDRDMRRSNDHDAGLSPRPDGQLVRPDSARPSSRCRKAILGRHCTKKGGECGAGGTCLVVDDGKHGVCTCPCTPDNVQTQLVNEDSCPDQPRHVCGRVPLATGKTRSYCFRTCKPKLGANDCDAPLACKPDSTRFDVYAAKAVCATVGCSSDLDCPVMTGASCDTVSDPCPSGQRCVPFVKGRTRGRCALAGLCDRRSGLCAPRRWRFNASARVGDPCRDSTACGANMRCEMEEDLRKTRKAAGEPCTWPSECCSRRCTSGRCAAGPCGLHARNGYCVIEGCAFASTLKEFSCPAGSSCSRLAAGGMCMKSCSLSRAADCRGLAADRYGDYECHDWSRLSIAGHRVSSTPICGFADEISCSIFTNVSFGCAVLGGASNRTDMACRGLDGKKKNQHDPTGFCLDTTGSGWPRP